MSIVDFLKEHPLVSGVAILPVLLFLGFLASNFTQGSFVDSEGCPYTPLEKPGGGEFTSIDQVQTYLDERGESLPGEVDLRIQDGVVHHSIPGECGELGGVTG